VSLASGPILLQRRIEVRGNDDAHSLAERVFEQEKLALLCAVLSVRIC